MLRASKVTARHTHSPTREACTRTVIIIINRTSHWPASQPRRSAAGKEQEGGSRQKKQTGKATTRRQTGRAAAQTRQNGESGRAGEGTTKSNRRKEEEGTYGDGTTERCGRRGRLRKRRWLRIKQQSKKRAHARRGSLAQGEHLLGKKNRYSGISPRQSAFLFLVLYVNALLLAD